MGAETSSARIKRSFSFSKAIFILSLLTVSGCSDFNPGKDKDQNKEKFADLKKWPEFFNQATNTPLPGTDSLLWSEPIDVLMRQGINRFLDRKISESESKRETHWKRDPTDTENYEASVASNRSRFMKITGVVDKRIKTHMTGLSGNEPLMISEMPGYEVFEVQWPVLETVPDLSIKNGSVQADWSRLKGPMQVEGEGLLLKPRNECLGYVIVLPDADQTPEQLAGLSPGIPAESQVSRRLVENGFCVVSPVLLNRDTSFSFGVLPNRRTHRDWIYTPAFEMGRHPAGFEIQKVLAAIDWCSSMGSADAKIALAGYGEGGQIAMYSAAIDPRVDAVLVSGYYGPRERIWQEPLYRNIWGLLDEFGDAEIATMIAPRSLVVEYTGYPEWKRDVDNTGPGELVTPSFTEVSREFNRINTLIPPDFGSRRLINASAKINTSFGSQEAIKELIAACGIASEMTLTADLPADSRINFDPDMRQGRAVKQMENHIQLLLRNSEYLRDSLIMSRLSLKSEKQYLRSIEKLREEFQYEHIGWFDEPLMHDLNPRSRKIYDEEKWVGYDVVVDVWPDVFAWGVLCIPKDIKPGERRPVVICQHGLEGTPYSTIDPTGDYKYYKSFTAKLAEEGFITFAPHNLYRGENEFRVMQRKANPLKASLYSIITPQHSQILNFLESLPFVDKDRIAFYGLSYGGKSAMRIPAIEKRYMLSICSGDFNEWVRINTDIHFPTAYMYRGSEYEMVEWDLGHSFNYAEMAYLIAPRPFMVERGHSDGVGIDTWVAYEFERVRRIYKKLGIEKSCKIEYFDGPHTINGVGTFEFLHDELEWPETKE